MFDVFFIYNGENNGKKNYRIVKKILPHAQTIKNSKSIKEAHINAACLSKTQWFFTIDADNVLIDKKEIKDIFFLINDKHMKKYNYHYDVCVFNSVNNTNKCCYGWGAVKLWNRNSLMNNKVLKYTDFTTSFNILKLEIPISIHEYNISPFDTWKSVFREYFKLKLNYYLNNKNTKIIKNLNLWENPNDIFNFKDFYIDAINYVKKIFDNKKYNEININDFIFLKRIFEQRFNTKIK